MKKIISLIVALMLIVALVPSAALVANAVTTVTEAQFATKIAELKKEYPEDKYWSSKNGTIASGTYKGTTKAGSSSCNYSLSYCGTFALSGNDVAYQCHGFALLLAHKIFGSNANKWDKYTSTSRQIYAGDVIRIDVNGNGINEDAIDHTINC